MIKKVLIVFFAVIPNLLNIGISLFFTFLWFSPSMPQEIAYFLYGVSFVVSFAIGLVILKAKDPIRWVVLSWVLVPIMLGLQDGLIAKMHARV